jgi:putative transcriptional regulator
MEEKKRVYNRIKAVLAEKHKTNKELSDHLKKQIGHISRYVTNDVQPPIPILFQIADFLECDVRELLVSSLEPPVYIEK